MLDNSPPRPGKNTAEIANSRGTLHTRDWTSAHTPPTLRRYNLVLAQAAVPSGGGDPVDVAHAQHLQGAAVGAEGQEPRPPVRAGASRRGAHEGVAYHHHARVRVGSLPLAVTRGEQHMNSCIHPSTHSHSLLVIFYLKKRKGGVDRTPLAGAHQFKLVGYINITTFYGSSCANNGKGALNTPETLCGGAP
eukprot:1196095-Prorocentrum_minimum.AAC.1